MATRSDYMSKRWKALDDLECVKRHGFSHKVAHFIGTNELSWCMVAIGRMVNESFIEVLKNPTKINTKKAFDQFKE